MSQSSVPKYVELSRELIGRIEAGEFADARQMPTEQELGDAYKVSRYTVRQAMALLEEEKYIERRRGAGTFVRQVGPQGRPIKPLESILLMIVDCDDVQDNGYSLHQVAGARQWADERDIALVVSGIRTSDVLRGSTPAVMRQDFYQAIFFDGRVTNTHCVIAQEMKIPYLVVGNHAIDAALPQVTLDAQGMLRKMVDHVDAIRPGQPLAMIVEPLTLQISREMTLDYLALIRQRGQKRNLLEITPDQTVAQGVAHLLDMADGPFSLLVPGGKTLPEIVDVYRQRGLDPRQYPIIAVTHAFESRPMDRTYAALYPFDPGQIISHALSRFVEAYAMGATDTLHDKVLPAAILPAQGG